MLARILPFAPDHSDGVLDDIPSSSAVFLLRGAGEPYISKTANLRRRLQRLLRPPEGGSKRLNLRERVREAEFTCTGSDFESNLLLYQLLRQNFPDHYSKRVRLRPAPLVKLHLENEYPRASVTTRLGSLARAGSADSDLPKANLYYGPFPSRVAAEKFSSDVLDLFKMRRCVEDLHPDPAFPGCIYSEMKMCLAPCFKGCGDDEYQAEVGRVQAFFDNAGESLMRELGAQRERASAELAFEEAATIHARIEKVKPVLAQLPEIVRRIDQLDALIVQPASTAGSVCLFRFRNARIAGPIAFLIEDRHEIRAGATTNATALSHKPKTMEGRVEEAIHSFPLSSPGSSAERNEHLAMLKRWYYRSNRVGEIFFADEKGVWPLRRIVRGIGRVHKGEKENLFGSTAENSSNPQTQS